MAKDITIRVTGQNPDGTLNVQQVDGSNPFMPQTTSMVPANGQSMAMQPMQQGGYRAKFGNVEVIFASEADFLKADRALREMVESQNVPALGGVPATRGTGNTSNWLRTGADAAQVIAGILYSRNTRRKIDDLEDALEESREARRDLDELEHDPQVGRLVPVMRRLFLAERDATEASVSVLEDQLTAMDIQTGSGVAKVAADFLKDGPSAQMAGENGLGTAVAVGGAGLGLGLLLSSNRDSDRSRRRRAR